MTGKRLSNGIAVNFDEDRLGTGVRVAFKDVVISFLAVKKTLTQAEREHICSHLEEGGSKYFSTQGRTTAAVETRVLVEDLIAAGISLSREDTT